MPTTVMSVRGFKPADLLNDDSFAYVGRRCAGWPASVWGNPWRPRDFDGGARECVEYYAIVMRAILRLNAGRSSDASGDRECVACIDDRDLARLNEAARRLPELRGKRLGCWCGSYPQNPDLLCHGVILAQLCNALDTEKTL
jgi:hypothetical protein